MFTQFACFFDIARTAIVVRVNESISTNVQLVSIDLYLLEVNLNELRVFKSDTTTIS
jgi:hypothetical protein